MQKRDEKKKEGKEEKEKKKNRINNEKVTRDNWINTKLYRCDVNEKLENWNKRRRAVPKYLFTEASR